MILLARIDVSMIQRMCDYSAVGLYTSGYTIGSLLMFVTNAIGNAWVPLFNERLDRGDTESIRRDNKILMEAGCFMTLCFIAVAPEVVKLLYAKPYWESMWVVAPVALGTLCQYFYTNYVNTEIFYRKTALVGVNSCMAAIVNIVLNYIFISEIRIYSSGLYDACGLFHSDDTSLCDYGPCDEEKNLSRQAIFWYADNDRGSGHGDRCAVRGHSHKVRSFRCGGYAAGIYLEKGYSGVFLYDAKITRLIFYRR